MQYKGFFVLTQRRQIYDLLQCFSYLWSFFSWCTCKSTPSIILSRQRLRQYRIRTQSGPTQNSLDRLVDEEGSGTSEIKVDRISTENTYQTHKTLLTLSFNVEVVFYTKIIFCVFTMVKAFTLAGVRALISPVTGSGAAV